MLRFFRNTKLYKQIAEINEARKSLRQAEHRASLKIKRTAVRMHLYTEMIQMHNEQIRLSKQLAITSSNITIMREILMVHQIRMNHIQDLLASRGETIPTKPHKANAGNVTESVLYQLQKNCHSTSVKNILDEMPKRQSSGMSDKVSKLTEDFTKSFENLIPAGVGSTVTRKLTSMALQDSLEKIEVDSDQATVALKIKLIKSMINELNLSRQEVENMIDQIESGSSDSQLRSIVLGALDGRAVDIGQGKP